LNCQDFAIELLNAIGVPQFEQFLGPYTLSYLRYLRNTGGNPKAVYTYNDIEHTFNTHAELDEHVHQTLRKGSKDPHNEDRLNLLKSFDRAFHFRHESNPTEETLPHPKLGCPWGSPTRI